MSSVLLNPEKAVPIKNKNKLLQMEYNKSKIIERSRKTALKSFAASEEKNVKQNTLRKKR